MTPLQLFRETAVRTRSWPPYAWAIVGGATASMFIAVTLFAWHASRTMMPRRAAAAMPPPPIFIEAPADVLQRLEENCLAIELLREQQVGIHAPGFTSGL